MKTSDFLQEMYTVYILRCNDSSLYTGITNNLPKRLGDHNEGRGSKYVRSKLPFKCVYAIEVADRSLALKMERKIKQMTRLQKEELIKKGGSLSSRATINN